MQVSTLLCKIIIFLTVNATGQIKMLILLATKLLFQVKMLMKLGILVLITDQTP